MTWGPRRPPFGPIRIPAGIDIIKMFERLAEQGLWPKDMIPREDTRPTKMIKHELIKVEPIKQPRSMILEMEFKYTPVGENEGV